MKNYITDIAHSEEIWSIDELKHDIKEDEHGYYFTDNFNWWNELSQALHYINAHELDTQYVNELQDFIDLWKEANHDQQSIQNFNP